MYGGATMPASARSIYSSCDSKAASVAHPHSAAHSILSGIAVPKKTVRRYEMGTLEITEFRPQNRLPRRYRLLQSLLSVHRARCRDESG